MYFCSSFQPTVYEQSSQSLSHVEISGWFSPENVDKVSSISLSVNVECSGYSVPDR